jgi:Ulp1 family protease
LQPEFFNAQFDYGNAVSYTVEATWTTNFNSPSTTVTLLTHTQLVNIARGVRLACVSQKFVRLWQEYMRKWSSSLQLAYSIMRDPKYIKTRKVAIGHEEGKHIQFDSDESCDDEVDTSDLEAVLPDIQELQSTDESISMNIQHLASLHPTQMLHENVLQAYMVLLEAGVPHIFFPLHMTGMYKDLRLSNTKSNADNQALCRRYLFRKITPTDRSTFIFALNPGLHWIAFKVDFSKKYIASMCSLQDPLHETAKAVLHCISSVYPKAASFEHFSVTVPNQNNAFDCGPLCCMFMLYLSQTDISRSSELSYATHSTASAMRLRIFADIARKILTPLVTKS